MADSDADFEALVALAASDDPADVQRAHDQALLRMASEPRARLAAAIAYDRLRVLAGREQKFGTQAVLCCGERRLWPLDRGTSDSERSKWGLPSLSDLEARLAMAPLVGKACLRRLLRDRRQALSATEVAARSDMIAALGVTALAPRATGGVVAAYWPLPGEADPRPLARLLAWPEGVRLALPVVAGERMSFRAWHDDYSLVPAGFGTLGPPDEAAEVQPTIVLTPLLGFDRRGARLGQGKGYYDRKLAELPGALVVGVAFADQQLPAVPTEAHDRSLDMIVTELAVTAFST